MERKREREGAREREREGDRVDRERERARKREKKTIIFNKEFSFKYLEINKRIRKPLFKNLAVIYSVS